jgi:signal transduction histidine kinase
VKLTFLRNSRTWNRFGQVEFWGWPAFWFILGFIALLSYSFDAVRLDNYSIYWIPINLISFLASAVVALLLVALVTLAKVRPPYLTFANLAIAAFAMGVKNSLTLMLCAPFGIQDSGPLWSRFVGGLAVGIAIFLAYGNLVATRLERRTTLDFLAAKEQALSGFRENINEMLVEEEEELRRRTQNELLPRFQALQARVELGSSVKSLTSDLSKLLTNDVRPLSQELARAARRLAANIPSGSLINTRGIEVQVAPSKMFQPVRTFLFTSVVWWAIPTLVFPGLSFVEQAEGAGIYLASLALIKVILLPFKPVSTWWAWMIATLGAFIATLPSYYWFFQIPHSPIQSPLISSMFVAGAWVVLFFSNSYILDLERAALESKLKEVVTQFTSENKLFEQKLWISQHIWYTLLHGTVQSALTAASIRAGGKKSLSVSDREAIASDLKRAIDALKNPALAHLSVEESLLSLRETWQGICDIEVKLGSKTEELINSSQDTVLVLNEILKEALSNSVKHGQATQAKILIRGNKTDGLEILVTNNGTKPIKNFGSGIGNQIFETLCISHELTWNNETKESELLILIPVG